MSFIILFHQGTIFPWIDFRGSGAGEWMGVEYDVNGGMNWCYQDLGE